MPLPLPMPLPMPLGMRPSYLINQETELGPQRCVELTGAAGRSSCKQCKDRILEGEVRFGVKTTIVHVFWGWHHPKCLTDRQCRNVAKLGYKKVEDIFGYDALPENKRCEIDTLWARIQPAVEQIQHEKLAEEMKEEVEFSVSESDEGGDESEEGTAIPAAAEPSESAESARPAKESVTAKSRHQQPQPLRKKAAKKAVAKAVKTHTKTKAKAKAKAKAKVKAKTPAPVTNPQTKIKRKGKVYEKATPLADHHRLLPASASGRKRKMPMRFEIEV
jgi:hypothetical protein